MPQGDGSLLVRDATIFYRNFRGEQKKYNAAGERNFCLELDPETAEQLRRDGWLVKETAVRDEGDEPSPFIQVKVRWGVIHQPRIFLVTTVNGERARRTLIHEDMVELLDSVDIANVDLVVKPVPWTQGGKSGIAAYLKSMYITMVEDPLEEEYAVLDKPPPVEDDD